nr:hypothetical protein [uncultured Mediterranean phage uvMED]
MEMEISSRFHKYINYMLTTEDRFLMKLPPEIGRHCEIIGWWSSQDIRRQTNHFKKNLFKHPVFDAIVAHCRSEKFLRELPLVMACWDGNYRLLYLPMNKDDPMACCDIASADAYEMRREAKQLGIWIDSPAEVSDPVILNLRAPIN